ncbi:GNAT family N-acetyltransferase [Cucumibacter marinus]|uniref:GNAT family N-acetyltransferase n=1 Tax=Cucumibacter marinus TaxID=1121252 RepID=UPI00041A03CE|nr:GNAT family protein [Cucumibacter marinus]
MLGPFFGREHILELSDGALLLRPPRQADFNEWRRVRLASRAFLKPFEPVWAETELTQGSFRARIRRYAREIAEETGFTFFLYALEEDEDPRLIGGITLSNIRRRVAQAGTIGYWMAADEAGKGWMTRAVGLLLPFSFHKLGLHRVEAACLPHNKASIRVLEKNGFRQEGLAEKYLLIDGKWQDHLLFGLTVERYEDGWSN